MRSTSEHPKVVQDYLSEESTKGKIIRPLDPAWWPNVHISRLGVVPKKQSDCWCLILDLSAPEGWSVNDGINPTLCSFSYISVDQAAEVISRIGHSALLAKVDIKSAYRIVPIYREDCHLLGMLWEGGLIIDLALPFGLRSAPIIFTALADAITWFMKKNGVTNIFHYLDDYLLIGNLHSTQCESDLEQFLAVLRWLKVPVAKEKLEGPSTQLTFLGIKLNTQQMIQRLPAEKLDEIKVLVDKWLGRKSCTKQELQSLVGKLQHACKVVCPGRSFMRRMYSLLKDLPKKQQFVRLNVAFHSDLLWWYLFLDRWNGVSMLAPPLSVGEEVFSDVSGSFGCGAWWHTH